MALDPEQAHLFQSAETPTGGVAVQPKLSKTGWLELYRLAPDSSLKPDRQGDVKSAATSSGRHRQPPPRNWPPEKPLTVLVPRKGAARRNFRVGE